MCEYVVVSRRRQTGASSGVKCTSAVGFLGSLVGQVPGFPVLSDALLADFRLNNCVPASIQGMSVV